MMSRAEQDYPDSEYYVIPDAGEPAGVYVPAGESEDSMERDRR